MSDAPQLLGPGEGEAIGGGRVRIKCARAELTLTETEGTGSTNPHIHLHHADAFRVLEGEVVVRVGDGEVALGPGDFALAPAGMVHCYRTDGARWLNLHTPDCGFAEYLRSGSDFDDEPPPEDGGRAASEAVVLREGEGEPLDLGPGARGVIKVGMDDLAAVEFELGPGSSGHPPHRHAELTDSFYVLDGTLSVVLGEERHDAPAGSYAVVPPGNVHTVSNPGEQPVRFLNISAPGGLDRYLRDLAANPGDAAAVVARHDVDLPLRS